jgi:serine/threonine protein kinase
MELNLLLVFLVGVALAHYNPIKSYSHQLQDECKWADFTLKRILGKGGHGVVIQAEHRRTGKMVALKVFDANKENINDLMREVKAQGSLDHHGITRIYCDLVVDNAVEFKGRSLRPRDPVMVLELIEGKSLRDMMKSRVPINVIGIIKQLVEVVAYIQSKHYVFGDLSSGNVMIENGSVKLVDFGATLEVFGHHQEPTPVFVNYKTRPHRWRNYAADWYSLGLLIEELLLYTQSGLWRDQRTFKGRLCKDLIKDKGACDLVGHLIPSNKDWKSIWGPDRKTLNRIITHIWFLE